MHYSTWEMGRSAPEKTRDSGHGLKMLKKSGVSNNNMVKRHEYDDLPVHQQLVNPIKTIQ